MFLFVLIQPPEISATNVTLGRNITMPTQMPFEIEDTVIGVITQLTLVVVLLPTQRAYITDGDVCISCFRRLSKSQVFRKMVSALWPLLICKKITPIFSFSQ